MPTELITSSDALWTLLKSTGVDWAINIISALAAWMIGRWLIKFTLRLFQRLLHSAHNIDRTLTGYLTSILSWILTLILILSILGIFGIQTTSFAALLAGLGLAVGTAWGGLLTHFAAGLFLQIIRPFQVGDTITGGGVTGKVSEIGVFSTTIITAGNVVTNVPNNKLFSDNIQNFSTQHDRRVDTSVIVPLDADALKMMALLKPIVENTANVNKYPAPAITVTEFLPTGIRISVSASTNNQYYSQVLTDINRGIAELLPGLKKNNKN